MGYLLPGHREDEFGADRGPLPWSAWPERPVIGDRVQLEARAATSRFKVGMEAVGPNGEIAIIVKVHPGSAMFHGSITLEVVGLPLVATIETHPRSRISSVGQ